MPEDEKEVEQGPGQLAADGEVPISRQRVKACFDSAGFWVQALPRYADRRQRWADFWAILAGIVGAVTGLAIWPVVSPPSGASRSIDDPVVWLVSAGALATAICALVPRVMNYGELAGQARELSSRYGAVLGNLEDLVYAHGEFDQRVARAVVTEFEATKSKKDSLRGLPDREETEARRAAALRALAVH